MVQRFYERQEKVLAGDTPAGDAHGVHDNYFRSFRQAYEADPELRVVGSDVAFQPVSRRQSGQVVEIRVAVSVGVELQSRLDGSRFTGSETNDHLLVLEVGRGALRAVVRERNLGISSTTSAAPKLQLTPDGHAKASAIQLAEKATARNGSLIARAADPYPRLDYSAMANYASYWTEAPRAGLINEGRYGKTAGNDCTNFISQALHNGGWPIRDTTFPNRANLNYWDYNMTGPGRFTYSWSKAEENYRMLDDKAGFSRFSSINDALLADVLYADWNVGNSVYGDGKKDHVMIATRRTTSTPYYSQKSGNRHNVPPSTVIRNVRDGGGTKWRWYGLRT